MITEHPQFFTATILNWEKLLANDKYKDIVIESLKFLVTHNRIFVYAFVIMPNHIHLIWQMKEGINPSHVQRDFLKYTAQQIKFDLQKNQPEVLERFKVSVKDRNYQIWEHRPLSRYGQNMYTNRNWITSITIPFMKNGSYPICQRIIITPAQDFIYLMKINLDL